MASSTRRTFRTMIINKQVSRARVTSTSYGRQHGRHDGVAQQGACNQDDIQRAISPRQAIQKCQAVDESGSSESQCNILEQRIAPDRCNLSFLAGLVRAKRFGLTAAAGPQSTNLFWQTNSSEGQSQVRCRVVERNYGPPFLSRLAPSPPFLCGGFLRSSSLR